MTELAALIVALCVAKLQALSREDTLYIENRMPLQEFEQPPFYEFDDDAEAVTIKLE